MQEEFHGVWNGTVTTAYKLLYGWTPLNANVWLPSLSELIGITGKQDPTGGCYQSAMQGINLSTVSWTDAQGGNQFTYFQEYNTNSGGEAIMAASNQQQSWLRSPHCGWSGSSWSIENATAFNASGGNVVTLSHAVHPAGEGRTENKLILLRKCRN